MTSARFDAWTRRRFGLATGGLAVLLAGFAAPEGAGAKKHKNKKKKRKKRCKKIAQVCQQDGKRTCCRGKACLRFDGQNFRCCKVLGQPCSDGSECCSGWCIEDECGVT